MLAKDVMQKKLITARPEMTLREIAGLFVGRRVTGVPVVDRNRLPIGVISQTDLVRRVRSLLPDAAPAYFEDVDLGRLPKSPRELMDRTVAREAMTPTAFCADEETPLAAIALFMAKRGVHRVLITRHGRLTGIVTSMDVVRAYAALGEGKPKTVRRRRA